MEKVVKAPSSPTTRNARISADGDQTKADASIRTPSANEPSELTIKVPNGNHKFYSLISQTTFKDTDIEKGTWMGDLILYKKNPKLSLRRKKETYEL